MSEPRFEVRPLLINDNQLYNEFREKMWPEHPAAGAWEVVVLKYFTNPHVALCPGSGLYVCLRNKRILGIMGAYPAPINLNGSIYAGHLLADWAVLPESQYGPTAGYLWNSLLGLPGRKLTTIGSKSAQRIFEKRATRFHSGTSAVAILRPFDVGLLRALQLEGYVYPSPIDVVRADLPSEIQPVLADSFSAPTPYEVADTAYVARERNFWSVYCMGRLFNAAIPFRCEATSGEANFVLRVLEIGRLRYAILMAAQFAPLTIENARKTGYLLRRALRALRVCLVRMIDLDELTSGLLSALSPVVFRKVHMWYGIRRPSDSFAIEDVRWWLTNGDSDSHWGGSQPTTDSTV